MMSTYNRKGLAHSRKVITKSSLAATTTTRQQPHQVQSSIYRETLEYNRQKFHENLFSNHFLSSSSVLTIRRDDKHSKDLTNLFNKKLKNNNNNLPNDSKFENYDLPLIFTGISKPSSKIEKMISKRKNDHEEGLIKMNKELSLVQKDCDDEFFNRSRSVKIELNDLRLMIKKVLKEFDVKTSYDDSIFNKDLKIFNLEKLNDIIDREKILINNFYQNLLIIENKRRDNVTPILKYYYKYFQNLSHILPYEIQIYFENLILNYNEIILANHRVYADLRLKMLLISDNEKIGFKYWFDNFINK